MRVDAPNGGCGQQPTFFRVRVMSVICRKPDRPPPRPHTPRMRRLARIADWRIEVLALHGANRTRDVAVAWVRDTLQGGGKAEQRSR